MYATPPSENGFLSGVGGDPQLHPGSLATTIDAASGHAPNTPSWYHSIQGYTVGKAASKTVSNNYSSLSTDSIW